MIQRLIYTALESGRDAISKDPSLLEPIFIGNYGLAADEVATIKRLWAEKPPKVAHGYALATHTFPLWAIVLGSEDEKEKYLGDDIADFADPDDPDFGEDAKGAIWTHSYRILVYADHPEVALYYYEVAKSILLLAGSYFADNGLFEIHFTGRDLAPDPRYLPEHLFVRELSMRCEREFEQIDRAAQARLNKAFRVSGIHVDKSGSLSDVGGAKTLLTPYGGDDV